jgi:predicted RNA-binding protein with RPS1 domain
MADVPTAEVPVEVEKLDGVLSTEEQHNTERPARKSIAKKGPKGKPLSEFEAGMSLKGRVKSIASYGAFIDIGAETDGLLHISQLSIDYVANVNDVLEINKEYDVRITKIDAAKKQVALTLLTAEQEETAASNVAAARSNQNKREPRTNNSQQQRRDDSAILQQLQDKGWDTSSFVEGSVVSIVDFGAFVNIDAKQFNAEVEGVLDGLVHISALSTSRVNSVKDIVKIGDKVQIRLKAIDKGKVSLSMVTPEEESAKNEARGNSSGSEMPSGAKDWAESLAKIKTNYPSFNNKPMIVDTRK